MQMIAYKNYYLEGWNLPRAQGVQAHSQQRNDVDEQPDKDCSNVQTFGGVI